jgi:hypothetical protein
MVSARSLYASHKCGVFWAGDAVLEPPDDRREVLAE